MIETENRHQIIYTMKIRNLLTAAAVAMPFAMSASVPAFPGIQTMVNPDGSTVQLRQHGNHQFSYWTDADENVVMEKGANGVWAPVVRNGRVMTTAKADINLLRSEFMPLAQAPVTMAPIDSQGRTMYPTTGECHALVVLVEFQDVKFTVPDIRNAIDKMLNEEGYSDYNSNGSARDYYIACSNGQFQPTFDVCDVVTLSENVSFYGERGTYGQGYSYNDYYWSKGLREALLKLDDTVDFSKYDYDNDGKIDNIFFFYAGYGEADGTRQDREHALIWPHQGDYTQTRVLYDDWESVVLDGKTFATYACGNELPGEIPTGESYPYLTGIGTFCHEYGHVLGLPDMYDTNGGSTKTPGKFDIMDQGSYNGGYKNIMMTQPPLFSAYERWLCRWVEADLLPADIEDSNGDPIDGVDITLPTNSKDDINMAYARMKRPVGTAYWPEYYFFETRTPESWDSTLPQHGLYIWHVQFDRSRWVNNEVNTGGKPAVELVPYDSRMGIWTWALPDQSTFVYPGSANAIIPANSVPEGYGFFLTNMNYDEEEGVTTFEYNKYVKGSDKAGILYTPTREEKGRRVWLTWEPVEGATDYLVTVYRYDDNGNIKYMDQKNEQSQGNVTSCSIENLSTAAFDMELHAYVRPVIGIPSEAISNEQVFVPSTLIIGSDSVEGIDSEDNDFYPFGGVGCIEASEGSEAYNMSGMRVSMENLPAGVYIVKNNGKSVKVYVK